MTTRLEKSINGLKRIAERYSRQELFGFSKEEIKIKPKTDKAVWLWFYVIFLILTPTAFSFYLMTRKNPDTLTIILTIGLAGYFSITLWSLLNGQQTLTVDFFRKQFILENAHKTFTRQKEPKRVDFCQVHSVYLKQKALRYNNRWTRIYFSDVNGHNLAFIDFCADFPDSIIAEKVKFFLEVVLWTYNKKTLKCA